MENIQSKMKELFGGSCLAYCYAYIAGYRDIKDLTEQFFKGWKLGYIDDDGYVSKPVEYLKMLGMKDVKDIKKEAYKSAPLPQIVCYKYNKGYHFVIIAGDKVIFDPSYPSLSVSYGKIDSVRTIICK